MGDIIMTTPALRALKETFAARITLLTSSQGSGITPFIPEIDETIVADLPWVRTAHPPKAESCQQLIEQLKEKQFDLAIIFTVYSQCPLPAAFICWLANIPKRLAWCRENPYELLTDWVADNEPYTLIRHQVERDLLLIRHIGAMTMNDKLSLSYKQQARQSAIQKLQNIGLNTSEPWIVLHPGVSEKKREYPVGLWKEVISLLHETTGCQLLITGSNMDLPIAEELSTAIPGRLYHAAGLLNIEEFISIIAASKLTISVNTATVHIAAAFGTPVVVLYACTNPQHTPWKTKAQVLQYSVDRHSQSRNEVIRYVSDKLYYSDIPYPTPVAIVKAAAQLLQPSLARDH